MIRGLVVGLIEGIAIAAKPTPERLERRAARLLSMAAGLTPGSPRRSRVLARAAQLLARSQSMRTGKPLAECLSRQTKMIRTIYGE